MQSEMESQRPAAGPDQVDRNEVLRAVIGIVAEQMGMEPDAIRESAALEEDLGCDSLDIVEITMEIEEHFDISVPDEAGEDMKTIADVTDGVIQLLGRRQGD